MGICRSSRALLAVGLAIAALAAPTAVQAKTEAVRFVANADKGPTTVLNRAGLKLRATCDGDTNALAVVAKVKPPGGALVHVGAQGAGGGDSYAESDALLPGETVDVTAGLSDDSSGQLVYAPRGGRTVIAIDWLAEEGGGYDGTKACLFAGTARSVGKGSSGHVFLSTGADKSKRVFDSAGLRITASCDGGAPDARLRSLKDDALVHLNAQGLNTAPAYEGDNTFDDAGADAILLGDEVGDHDSLVGQIVYSSKPGGKVVTVDWAMEDDAFDPQRDCGFVGVARVAKPAQKRGVHYLGVGDDLLNLGGLELHGSTVVGNLNVLVGTARNRATVHVNSQAFGGSDAYGEEDGFSASARKSLFGSDLNGHDTEAIGQLIHTLPNGRVTTLDWLAQDAFGFGGAEGDVFLAVAESARD